MTKSVLIAPREGSMCPERRIMAHGILLHAPYKWVFLCACVQLSF